MLTSREDLPRFVEPMLARPGHAPSGDGWTIELKLDGCRGQLLVDRGAWCLRSRPGRDCSDGFPELAAPAEHLAAHRAILDGELVCLGADGKPDFHALRPRMLGRAGPPVTFAAFDLLHLDGHSTRRLPLIRRRELLRDLLPADVEGWCVVAPLSGRAADVLRVVGDAQLEGVVAKRLDAAYEPGARSGAWLKHKLRRSETFVVSGWSPARDRRPEAVLLVREDGRRAGAAVFGLTREERDRIRAAEQGLRVVVDFHGRADGPLRDAVMRRLVG